MRNLLKTNRNGRRLAGKTHRRLTCAVEPMERRLLMSTVTLTSQAATITDIEQSGPFVTNFAPVAGATGTSHLFKSFEVYEFDAGSAIFPGPSSLSTLTNINLTQDNSSPFGNFAGVAGTFNVYLIPDTTATTPTSSLVFNSDVTGLVGQAGLTSANASSYLLGSIAFTNVAGPASSVFTASGSSTAYSTLIGDLNANQTFRFAVTPASATVAADYEGNFGTRAPVFTLTGTGTAAEQFNFTSSIYSVNESAGTAVFSIFRGGDTTDTASVNYLTSDGTALNGTNYTLSSGTVGFAPGQKISTFTVPITNVSPQGGDKSFTVTLSSPSAATNPASLGAKATATETIVDVADITNSLTGYASTTKDIETSGPFSSTFAPVVGDSSGSSAFGFLSYEVLEFTKSTTPSIYPAAGFTVNSLQNLSLQLYNTASAATGVGNQTFAGHPGNFDVYFIPDSEAATPTTSLIYNSGDPAGLNGQAGTSAATLLGVFSFSSAATGFDTYTAAMLPASVTGALVADLNSGATFRLAVTPVATGKGATDADWDGVFSASPSDIRTPNLSFSGNVSMISQPETLAFQAANYSVNETAGTATITLSRSGAATDSATVNYATSDGTAVAGTNYAATTGTATFGVGMTTAAFTISITNVVNQGGDKIVDLTLSNPLSAGPGTIASIGSQSTALLTIADSSAAPTETLTQFSSDISDVEKKGPYTNTLFKVEGLNGASGFPSYGVADFNDGTVFSPTGDPLSITPAHPVTAINSINLLVVNGGSATSGLINVYIVPDAASNIDPSTPQSVNPHFFDTTVLPEGLGTQFGTPVLLGHVNWDATTAAFSTVTIPLANYSPAAEQTIINDLNNGVKFRVVAAPEDSTVFVNWRGNTSFNGVFQAPEISLNVQEATIAPLPLYITPSAGAVFTWNNTTGNLNLTSGTLTFTADQATSGDVTDPLVNLTAAGASSNVVFNTTQHIAGLTLNGGATAGILSGAGATLTTASLAVNSGSNFDITTNKVVINYGAPANDPVAALLANLTAGYHNGTWTGVGVTSSSAAASVGHGIRFTVGYADGAADAGYQGNPVVANQMIIKYTVAGNANLDQKVNISDLAIIAQNYNKSGKDYAHGNLVYTSTGLVGISSLGLVAQNYNQVGGAGEAANNSLTSAPVPSAIDSILHTPKSKSEI